MLRSSLLLTVPAVTRGVHWFLLQKLEVCGHPRSCNRFSKPALSISLLFEFVSVLVWHASSFTQGSD